MRELPGLGELPTRTGWQPVLPKLLCALIRGQRPRLQQGWRFSSFIDHAACAFLTRSNQLSTTSNRPLAFWVLTVEAAGSGAGVAWGVTWVSLWE